MQSPLSHVRTIGACIFFVGIVYKGLAPFAGYDAPLVLGLAEFLPGEEVEGWCFLVTLPDSFTAIGAIGTL